MDWNVRIIIYTYASLIQRRLSRFARAEIRFFRCLSLRVSERAFDSSLYSATATDRWRINHQASLNYLFTLADARAPFPAKMEWDASIWCGETEEEKCSGIGDTR